MRNVPEFDVTITMTVTANDEYYLKGETPVVTVTLADNAGPAAGAVYTHPPPLTYAVCHGEGRTADLHVTHDLIRFPPAVDPNE